MKKRYIFIPIILLAFIAQTILTYFVFDEIKPLISFLLTVPFYVIVYVYYRETKLVVTYSFISVFTTLSYWIFVAFIEIYPLTAPNMRLIGLVSFFGSIINMMIGFGIVLQATKNKYIAVSLMGFAVINFFFASYYNFFLVDLFAALFGPNQARVTEALFVLEMFYLVLQAIIVINQVIIIYLFDKNQDLDKLTFIHEHKD